MIIKIDQDTAESIAALIVFCMFIGGISLGIYECNVDDPEEIHDDCMGIVYEERENCIKWADDENDMQKCKNVYKSSVELCNE